MATHSNVLAWRIPGTREPGGLPSMRSHRVEHDWGDLAAAAAIPTLTHHLLHVYISGFWAFTILCTLEKAMATYSITLAWKIPWTEEPGGLQSMGLLRVRHDWGSSLSLFTFMHWRGRWQPTPVFLPGESQGRGSLVGCCLWGLTALDTTEVT